MYECLSYILCMGTGKHSIPQPLPHRSNYKQLKELIIDTDWTMSYAIRYPIAFWFAVTSVSQSLSCLQLLFKRCGQLKHTSMYSMWAGNSIGNLHFWFNWGRVSNQAQLSIRAVTYVTGKRHCMPCHAPGAISPYNLYTVKLKMTHCTVQWLSIICWDGHKF